MPHVQGMYTRLGRVFQSIVFGLSALFGSLTLLFPVPAITGVIGVGLTYCYGALLVLGGLGCLWGTLWPNFKIEIPFLFPLTAGWLVYSVSLWGVYADRIYHPNILTPPSYGSGIASAVVVAFFVWRLIWLIDKARELVKAVDAYAVPR